MVLPHPSPHSIPSLPSQFTSHSPLHPISPQTLSMLPRSGLTDVRSRILGKVRYIGASSMHTYQFLGMQHVAEKNGWTKFISMQTYYNLIYREEEREMLPACKELGVGYCFPP